MLISSGGHKEANPCRYLKNSNVAVSTRSLLPISLSAGFPLAIFFAWAFELTPDGLKRENEVDCSQSIAHETSRKLDFVIIGVLVLSLGYFAYLPHPESRGEGETGNRSRGWPGPYLR